MDHSLLKQRNSMFKKRRKRVRKLKPVNVVCYFFLSILAALVVFPIVWMVSASLDKIESYVFPYPPRLIPKNLSFFNYQIVFINMNMLRYLFNTSIVTAMNVVLTLLVTTLTGFCLSKGKFPGKGLLLVFILSNLMVPFESKIISIYRIILGLNLTNNFIGVVLPSVMTNAFFIFFVKKFCDDLPDALYEAGVLDGASKLRIYAQVFLPLMGPVMATIAMMRIMHVWNELLWPMVVLNSEKLITVQIGLALFSTTNAMKTHVGVSSAMSMLAIFPLLVIFVFLQRYIVQSIAATGLRQ